MSLGDCMLNQAFELKYKSSYLVSYQAEWILKGWIFISEFGLIIEFRTFWSSLVWFGYFKTRFVIQIQTEHVKLVRFFKLWTIWPTSSSFKMYFKIISTIIIVQESLSLDNLY